MATTPPRPSAAPPQGPSAVVESSPVAKKSKFYAQHKRDELEAFDDDYELKTTCTQQDFTNILDVNVRELRSGRGRIVFSLADFVDRANELAASVRSDKFPAEPELLFKATGNKPPLGHVTDTEVRPDIVAAFKDHWNGDRTPWGCARLAGEKASSGKTKAQQEKQAKSYLQYLLLNRPDLHVAQALLIDEKAVHFYLGIAGLGIRKLSVKWADETTIEGLMAAFIFRIFEPGHFADPSYLTVVDMPTLSVTYAIKLTLSPTTTAECPGFTLIHACHPFGTRAHVLSNPQCEVKVNGERFTIIKEQLCRRRTRFDERSVLNHVHAEVKVPGVIELVHHETIRTPLCGEREKHRLALGKSGDKFEKIPTAQKMLETLYDLLEVLRYLRFNRNVLHRDISSGNILYVEQPRLAKGPEEICFIKHLLDERTHPRETSALLIDFNHAERLDINQGPEHNRAARTGTQGFMARAVEMGGPVPLPEGVAYIPAMPESPAPYTLKHPVRMDRFPSSSRVILETDTVIDSKRAWRHELEHDAESVFWLLVYWTMIAQPKGSPVPVGMAPWSTFLGTAGERDAMLTSLATGKLGSVTHSFFDPLSTLIKRLAAIVAVDRHWLDDFDVRNQPDYVTEAFQRLILQFILDHGHEEFMTCTIDQTLRSIKPAPQVQRLSATTIQMRDSAERKRPSPLHSDEQWEGEQRNPKQRRA